MFNAKCDLSTLDHVTKMHVIGFLSLAPVQSVEDKEFVQGF